MLDQLGRNIEYLRVSVTQNCNLKCVYCSPDCENGACEILGPEEFGNVVRIMQKMGIRKVRITGGEPMVRKDIVEIVNSISSIPGIDDVSMTTNGLNLINMAKKLKTSGLKRLNISLDSLKSEKYAQITGGGVLYKVLDGIDAALKVGLTPIKINVVVIKGYNDDEIDDFIELARNLPVDIRFIELMPIGEFGENNADRIVPNSSIIAARPQLIEAIIDEMGQPARNYIIEGYKGRIGFISPMSHKFCNCCNRIRLTSDGKLRPCLGSNGEVDLLPIIKNGTQQQLQELIMQTIYSKPQGHNFEEGFASNRGMSRIGG